MNHTVTLLNVQLSFRGPLKYNSEMLKKLHMENPNSY
jgi:hypothetical protein